MPHIVEYLHKNVEISAGVYGAWPHGFYLEDRGCPKKPIRFDYEISGGDPGIREIDKLLLHNALHLGLIARGQFRGVVQRDRISGRLYLSLKSVIGLRPEDIPSESDAPPPIGQPDKLLHESDYAYAPKPQ